MDRVKIKEDAKQRIKGNIFNLIWPLLVIGILQAVVNNIFGGNSNNALVNLDLNNLDLNSLAEATKISPVSYLINILFSVVEIAYLKYVLNFVRTGKLDFNDIIDCLKEKWLNIFVVALLIGLAIGLGLALFIIPGIIIALGFAMAPLIVIDTDLGPIDAIKESWKMMTGYKWNYLVFILSFLGWILLSPLTLFLLLIWLVPYMHVAEILYYEELNKNGKK